MSLYNGPPRPGARGGRAEFSWENVKSDKDRDYYLGHSVKASTGRWQKGKDIFWYSKDKADTSVTQDELEAVKARERELMAEALGLKPKSAPSAHTQPALEKHEVERLLKGSAEDQEAAGAGGADADRIKGLGFASGAAVAVREEVHEVLPGTLQPGARPGQQLLTAEQLAALEKASAAGAAGRAGMAAPDKARKEKKEKRKHKKEKDKKKHKKEKKKHKARSRSRSPDSSSSSDSQDRDRHRLRRQEPQQQHQQQQQQQQWDRSRHRGSDMHGARDEEQHRQLQRRWEDGRRDERPQERYSSRDGGGYGGSRQIERHDWRDSREHNSRERHSARDRDRHGEAAAAARHSSRHESRSRSRSPVRSRRR